VGCTFADGDVGDAGVAVLQTCGGSVQLRLLDGYDGTPLWTRDVAGGTTLAGVEQAVVVAGDDGVQLLSGADGAPLAPPVAETAGEVLATGVGTSALVWADGTLTVVDQGTGAVSWRTPATGLPAGTADRALPAEGTSVPVPEGDTVVLRDLATGDVLQRVGTLGLDAGGLVTVAGPVVVHQLTDRVLAYR
jgi:hypothetical protein